MTSRCHDNHFSGSRQNLAAIRTPLLIAVSYCSRGGSRIFFRRVCTRLLLYFNTNKPHSFFGGQNSSCIRKPPAISGGGGAHPLHPPPRSAAVFTKYSRHRGLSIPKNENNNGLWTPLLCSMQTFEAVRAILWRNLCVSRWSIPAVKGHKVHEHALLCSGM